MHIVSHRSVRACVRTHIEMSLIICAKYTPANQPVSIISMCAFLNVNILYDIQYKTLSTCYTKLKKKKKKHKRNNSGREPHSATHINLCVPEYIYTQFQTFVFVDINLVCTFVYIVSVCLCLCMHSTYNLAFINRAANVACRKRI